MHELTPWKRRPVRIPPDSLDAWMQLAVWELLMGMLQCLLVALGVTLIVTASDRIVTFSDLSHCYAPPPVAVPCERIVYRGGVLNAAFSALFGVMLIGQAAWFAWELWNAVAPKPITDDFLGLLDRSFGHTWRNPFRWPWKRLCWAYGFTLVGAVATAALGMSIWTLAAAPNPAKAPKVRVETSQIFTVSQ
jgi:hypothetical protein